MKKKSIFYIYWLALFVGLTGCCDGKNCSHNHHSSDPDSIPVMEEVQRFAEP